MILFDLDGTLVDTAPDLAYALNLQRERHGLEKLTPDIIRPYASHGSVGLLSIGFDLRPEDEAFGKMQAEYLNFYNQVFTRSPVFFEGIADLLLALHHQDIKWGVVTNKPRRFAAPLLESIQLPTPMTCLICGDDAPRPKPAPDTLLLACAQSAVKPEECFYVGDAARDIEAGTAAGMKTVVALYGYIDSTDEPMRWGADFLIKHPTDLMPLITIGA